MDGEHHAGREGIGHLLDADADGHLFMRKAHFHPVGDGAPGVKAGNAAPHVMHDIVDAADPQVGVLLARKAGAGQVFGRGAGAYRDRNRRNAAAYRQFAIRLGDQILELDGDGTGFDHLANDAGGLFELVHVFMVEPGQQFAHRGLDACVAHELPEAMGRQGEARRYPHSRIDEFAQRRALAPHQIDGVLVALLEPAHHGCRAIHCRLRASFFNCQSAAHCRVAFNASG